MLRIDCPLTLMDESTFDVKKDMEKWEKSKRMYMMIMKKVILKAFKGSMFQKITTTKEFLVQWKDICQWKEKAEIGMLLRSLISMRYTSKGNTREYILEMSHAAKLKILKLKLSEDLLVHLLLISLLIQFNQFKVSYNYQNEIWSLNELILHCVKKKKAWRKIRQKVLTWPQPLSIRTKENKKKDKEAVDTAPQKK